MGNILMKCKECFRLLNQKPKSQIQNHQPVNLSNNPAEETQGKINALQISFTQDPSQSNERTISQIDEKNENEITLENISNKQLSAVRSSELNKNQNEEEQFVLNDEFKTNSSLDSPYPLLLKVGQQIILPSINNINIEELQLYAQDALKKVIELTNKNTIQEDGEYLVNNNEINIYASHKIRNKKMYLIIKFSFELNTNVMGFLNWSNQNQLFSFDLINTYNLQKLNEEISIGEIILNRQGMIKQQYLTYVKTVREIDSNHYIAFQSVRFQDKFQDNQNKLQEGYLNLGGLKISQKNNSSILIIGYIDADFGIKVGFHLTLKTIREKVITSVIKLRELFG